LPPYLSVVQNSSKRVWQWASKERPVLDGSHGGSRSNYHVRVNVCTSTFNAGCQRYPSGHFKPVGLLHEYGETDSMLFGLLTGSYNKNMSGGVLRRAVASFREEVNAQTGQFTNVQGIVGNFDQLRIRDYNNGNTGRYYRGGWLDSRPMSQGTFVDWGNPVAEMMYEGLRYFAGKGSATPDYATSGGADGQIGLSVANWDNPYDEDSQAQAPTCAKPNLLVMSDINPSFDSDQLPGSFFDTFSGDMSGMNVQTLSQLITDYEPNATGQHFIGQSRSVYDGAPTAKNVTSLGNIRGLAPEEPTKQGSYYSAAVAHYGKTTDINPVDGEQTVDSFFVALTSPLPKIEFEIGDRTVALVPFAKTVNGSNQNYQPTNQIVDFYVETYANFSGSTANPNINGGRPYTKFRINFEDVEQGADHDMDSIVEYELQLNNDNSLSVELTSVYAAGGYIQHAGYVVAGTTADGTYIVVRDLDTASNRSPLPLNDRRTFTPGNSGATLLEDPLWYAAKWGAFEDSNNNNIPDLNHEWDEDNNGVPDAYFLVQNPLKLSQTLRRTLDSIISRTGNASNLSGNSTSINTNSEVYQSVFNTGNWSGDVLAYTITEAGVANAPSWSAAEQLPEAANRDIFTTNSDGAAVAFEWDEIGAADQTALGSNSILNYVRGERGDEQQFGGTLRNRALDNVLGDIVHSSTVYEKDLNMVYVGSNGGMLHGFDANTGEEQFAYIPSTLMPKLPQLADTIYDHAYFVDGEIAVSNQAQTQQNLLVATIGRGEKGLFALDVTNPRNFSASNVAWEYVGDTDEDLGYMLGAPIIAQMNNGEWAAIVGNGYNATSGAAALYIFNLRTGAVMAKIDTHSANDNGLATPGVFDADGNGTVDVIYAGDLKGHVWKFDVSDSSESNWRSAFGSTAAPEPFFTATDSDGNAQPITAPLTISLNDVTGDENYAKRFVFFGTGSHIRATDPADDNIQSWYGLIDDEAAISGRSTLVSRSVESEGEVDDKPVRVFEEKVAGDMLGRQGWYIDFSELPGERIISATVRYPWIVPTLVVSSFQPVADPCQPGGRGFINAIDPFTGARLGSTVFDINDNNDFTDDMLDGEVVGSLDLELGQLSQPIAIGQRLVVGAGDGSIGSIRINQGAEPIRGRIYWRQILTE